MGEFLRGWRRKIGVVTLLLACMFLAGWLRSALAEDSLSIRLDKWTEQRFVSSAFGVCWLKVHTAGFKMETLTGEKSWIRFKSIQSPPPKQRFRPYYVGVDYKICQVFDKSGFIFGRTFLDEVFFDVEDTFWVFPYWSIVLPLTALSAFLLLSKPRRSSFKELNEPTVDNEPVPEEAK